MIQRMIENDLLTEINFDNIPISRISASSIWNSPDSLTRRINIPYHTAGELSVSFTTRLWWMSRSTAGRSSGIQIQGQHSDAGFCPRCVWCDTEYLGYSLNSTDLDELTEAKNLLIEQKPLVQAYVIDQVRDKMIGNEAALGVIYSGEAIYTQKENPNLEYVIPKEGSNIWIDSWGNSEECRAQGKCRKIHQLPLQTGHCADEL